MHGPGEELVHHWGLPGHRVRVVWRVLCHPWCTKPILAERRNVGGRTFRPPSSRALKMPSRLACRSVRHSRPSPVANRSPGRAQCLGPSYEAGEDSLSGKWGSTSDHAVGGPPRNAGRVPIRAPPRWFPASESHAGSATPPRRPQESRRGGFLVPSVGPPYSLHGSHRIGTSP